MADTPRARTAAHGALRNPAATAQHPHPLSHTAAPADGHALGAAADAAAPGAGLKAPARPGPYTAGTTVSAADLEALTRAAGDVVSLVYLACELVAQAEAGDTGTVHRLGAVLRALKAQAGGVRSLADAHWMVAHAAERCPRVAAVAPEGGAA